MGSGRTVTLWSAGGLTVTARRGPEEGLVLEGQDLRPGPVLGAGVSEYEYGLGVAAGDVPAVVAALGAPPGTDVLDALERFGAAVVETGESRWLAGIGVEAEFWFRSEGPDD
jgi:hypothetical protein